MDCVTCVVGDGLSRYWRLSIRQSVVRGGARRNEQTQHRKVTYVRVPVINGRTDNLKSVMTILTVPFVYKIQKHAGTISTGFYVWAFR